jgi:hypothetical protein
MENEELIKQVTEKAEKWLTPAYDAETQAEIKKMLANPDKTDLIEAFYKDLEFGTGGLRGIMGVGSNRMNIYTVGAATQGLSNYLNKNFKDLDQISVVVGHDCRVVVLVEGLAMILSSVKAHIWQALAATLFVALCVVGFKLVEALHDRDTARTALANEQRDRADENRERMRVALDDARETFRKGEIHARNQQEIAGKYIEDAGYGQYFTHGLGHGIGMNIHEDAYVNQNNTTKKILLNYCFSVEPGIYLTGKFGVRYEDCYYMTQNGPVQIAKAKVS